MAVFSQSGVFVPIVVILHIDTEWGRSSVIEDKIHLQVELIGGMEKHILCIGQYILSLD